jgi:hypothetical protein
MLGTADQFPPEHVTDAPSTYAVSPLHQEGVGDSAAQSHNVQLRVTYFGLSPPHSNLADECSIG